MADEEWGGDSYSVNAYDEAASYDGYAQNSPGYDLDEYWRVDAEVYHVFLELAPVQQGERVELNDLPELCRRVGRALRDDHEQFRVMQELDTTNSMQILRHDFVIWLLAEMHAQEQARIAAKPRSVPVATPAWEEVVQEVTEADQMLGSQPTVFYYNTLSGQPLNGRDGLLALIREVDPFSVITPAPGQQEQQPRHFYRALLGRGSGSSETASEDQVRQVFSVLDASGDGSVTLEEFQLWWKTKLQLEVKESEEVATDTREQRRRGICLKFLENADAVVLSPVTTTSGEKHEGATGDQQKPTTEEFFESNLLPRLTTLLGEFPLRGLAYRRALNDLVRDPMEQLVSLERFLVWYDGFEKSEREKLELQRAKQRAQAELRAQHEAQAAARQKQRRHRKQMRTMDFMSEQATAVTEHEAQKQREKKISVLFKTFDTDGSGLLDEQELLQLTKALGHDMDAAQVNRMIQVMDASGDGRVSLEEFLAFWKAFEHRRPAAATAASLHQDRRDAVSQLTVSASTATPSSSHQSTSDTLTSLAVSLEMAKDRALKLTMADMRGFLMDWSDDRREKRIEHQAEIDEAESIRKWRELHAFVPSKKRVYGAKRLDVTWIEPEVVDCVAAIIAEVGQRIDPPLKPDAAQIIQALSSDLPDKHFSSGPVGT
ncbi:hypothetical protein BBP00_00009706 [Phytophthora kernoviae]|uniref:EF-hand domain-containing protein n=1 Tax=Phytophthora kernoviae TaxID=325452 RepID=A0A3F2RBX4_9STRA|nr:hypothetical protein BBP00_00009706 [Phytophthora kernoviae]